MNKKGLVSQDELLAEFRQSEEFRAAERKLKPYYDLVVQIIKRREELGLTQEGLAKRAKTYQSRISKIESAEHDIRLSTLIDIAEALQTEVDITLKSFADETQPTPIQATGEYFRLFTGRSEATQQEGYSISDPFQTARMEIR